jgi:hypothetical protein
MIGEVTVLTPDDYKKWLDQSTSGMSLAQNGERLFASMGCNACHSGNAAARGPTSPGLRFQAQLTDGSQRLVDDAYLRDAILNPSQHVTAGLRSHHAHLPGPDQRRRPDRSGRVHQETAVQLPYAADADDLAVRPGSTHNADGGHNGNGEAMSPRIEQRPSDAYHPLPARPEHGQMPKRHYLNNEDGLLSWLLTGDHKRIAILYLISITFFFFIGGAFAGLIRLELLTPQPDLVAADTYNKFFTMHGIIMVFLFLVPSVPATLGNFLIPIMLGREGPRLPQDQPAELVPVRHRRHAHPRRPRAGRRGHRLDLHHAALHALPEHPRPHRGHGHLHRRLQLHLHRAELHRHHPPHALPRHDLVPYAALRVVALRASLLMVLGTPVLAIAWCWSRWSASSASASSTPPRAAIRCSSSISSGSTRTPPSTS